MKKYLFATLIIFLLIPAYTKAASLSLDAQKNEYHLGDAFTVNFSLDIDDVCINTVEAKITFPTGILYIEDFITGESLLNVWVDQPSETDVFDANDSGELYVAGGIPGGYCGKIPGDPGNSNLVGRILFRIPSFYVGDTIPDTLDIKLEDAKVYINDGLGTEDKLRIENLSLVLNKTVGAEVGDYDRLIKSDKTKPEPFVIELHQRDNMYQGQYFAIFSSIDKQSGIDHYELIETKSLSVKKTLTEKVLELFVKSEEAKWKIAETPFLLTDQSLRSIIKVKAIDKAGNERSVEYIPEEPNIKKALNFDYLIITIGVLLLIITIFFLYKIGRYIFQKIKSKKESSLEEKQKEEQN
ncbi:MAG: hypothetical protein PF572_04840 [Patescibacteria group bacterium]|jgi:hypothetical protein|nr:hypothetical protein [Patescibacteria group bacterium]